MGFAMASIDNNWSSVHYNPAAIIIENKNLFGGEYLFFTGGLESTSSLRNLPAASANPWKGDFVDFIGDEPGTFSKKSIKSDIHFGALGCISKKDKIFYGFGIYGSGSGTEWKDSLTSYTGDYIEAKINFINGSMKIPIVFAYELYDNLSLGASMGIHWGLLKVENQKLRTGHVPYISKTVQDTEGAGVSPDIGLLWKINPGLNFGAAVKFPYTFRKKGSTETEFSLISLNAESDTTVDMRYPLRIVLGISWNFLEDHLLAFNFNWHNWEKYNMKTDYKTEIPGIFEDSSGNPADWNNTIVLNLGYEYIISEKWTARCGLTYDEAPEPEDSRILTGGQVIDTWHFSAGTGINLGFSVINIGYIYSCGPEVDGFIPGAKYSMELHEFSLGLEKRF